MRLAPVSFNRQASGDTAVKTKHSSVWLLLLAVVIVACKPEAATPRAMAVAPSREALSGLLESESGKTVRPYMTYDFGRARDSRGISVVASKDDAFALVERLRPRVPSGWLVFAGMDRWLGGEDHHEDVEVANGPGNDQFDVLRLARSDAVNYGMETEDLVRRLKVYDSSIGLTILQANTDTVVSRMTRLPADVPAFAAEIYELCPDVVDQGVGSVEALAAELARSRVLYLWWD